MARPSTAVDANLTLIREFVLAKFESVKVFSEYIGSKPETLYQILNGQRNLTATYLKRIAKGLNVEPNALRDDSGKRFIEYIKNALVKQTFKDIAVENVRDLEKLADLAVRFGVLEENAQDVVSEETLTTLDWRNPDLYAFETENAMRITNSTAEEICVSGPTRCAKTTRILEYIIYLHFLIPGFQSRIVRSKYADLDGTIRKTLKELLKYDLSDPLSPIKVRGGPYDFHTLLINEGEMKLGGMDRPGKILGGGIDLVFYNQAEQSLEEEYQTLITRASGAEGNWFWEDTGLPRVLLISDANAGRTDHHLYLRKDDSDLEWIEFGFEDNPLYYRDNVQTAVGADVINRLNKGLTGLFHDRYFKAIWKSPEGAVFDVPSESVLKEFPDLSDCTFYRGMDFGMDHPTICLWVAHHNHTGDVFAFREWRKTHTNIIEAGHEINQYTEEDIIETVIDHDENRQQTLENECNISSVFAKKGPGSVMAGVHAIQYRLQRVKEKKDGGLYIYEDLVCNSDPNPAREGKPNSLLKELESMIFDAKRDAPVKENDDAFDALKYILSYIDAGTQWPLDDFGTIKL